MSLLFEALRDLAELALGCTSCRFVGDDVVDPSLLEHARMGGLVHLSSASTALDVGVLATPEHCAVLARRLLGQVAETKLPDALVHGAMCELAYLLAGGVKRRLSFVGALSVGQPAFFQGTLARRRGWETRLLGVELDAMQALLVSVAPSHRALLL
jgi:hypothetical protein